MDLWVYLVFLAALFIVLILFFIKHIWAPRKVDYIDKMISAGQYKKAIRESQLLIKKNERNHRAHFLLAQAFFQSKEMDQALIEYKFLTKLNRYDDMVREVIVRNRLADIFLHFGQMEEAQKEFLLIMRLNPSNYEVMFKIAKIFYDRNYSDNAYAYFTKVVKINQKHAESHFYLGMILFQAKKENEALAYLNNAVKNDPRMHKANYYLGLINKKNNSFHQAVINLEDAQRDPDYRMRARLAKGQCFLEMSDANKAIIEFESGLKDTAGEDNISLAMRYSLAAAYEQIRELPGAIEQWEKIANFKPNYQDVLEKLSLYQELRTDDHLKDFLTASNTVFEELCREMIRAIGYDIVKFSATSGNHAVVLATEPESKWRNIKVSSKLIHIYRESQAISEATVRAIQEEMKAVNANKAICITSTKFSPGAKEYAAARPIDLVDKQGLAKILKKI